MRSKQSRKSLKRRSPQRTGPLVLGLALLGCSADRGIERPRPLFSESPVEYPLTLWNQGVEGSTLVRVLVNETGGVDSVVVVESSGRPAFDAAAVEGAKAMSFEPATKDGEPLRVWARVPVHFSKKSGPPNELEPGPMAEGG